MAPNKRTIVVARIAAVLDQCLQHDFSVHDVVFGQIDCLVHTVSTLKGNGISLDTLLQAIRLQWTKQTGSK